MHRPFIVTLIGWLGILVGVVFLTALTVRLSFFDARAMLETWAAKDLPNLSLNLLLASLYVTIVLTMLPCFALLRGMPWSRVYYSVIYGIGLVRAAWQMQLYNGLGPQVVSYHLGYFCLIIGLPILLLTQLYSPAGNAFFHPDKDPVLFNHYETVRQIILLVALLSIGFGGYRVWEIRHNHVPYPTIITTTNPNAPKPLRTFTNNQGGKIRARLVYFDGAQVIIERDDGRRFTTPLSVYSTTDQTYIRETSGR